MKNIAVIQVEDEYQVIEIFEHRDHIVTKLLLRSKSVDEATESATILLQEDGGVPVNSMSSGNVAELSPLFRARKRLIDRFRRKSPA